MHYSKFIVPLLLLLSLAVAGAWLYAAHNAPTQPHLGTANCSDCHLASKNATPEQARLLSGAQESLCLKCHPKALQVSHPSGFSPRTTPPATYPLDWKGDITCSTCHEIHGSKAGLLRGDKQGKDLCFSCHNAKFFEKMRDGGSSITSGHLKGGIDPSAPNIDTYSQQCMACHASLSGKMLTNVDRSGIARHSTLSASHPIGAKYKEAMKFGGYRPLNQLSPKVMLPEGKVGCVSCHAGYSKDHGKLITPTARSALCFECHDL